eukprot:XP_015582682.2 disease resistance protein RGA2-like isoform X1 [Ricinus communis]
MFWSYNFLFRHRIGKEIKAVKENLDEIAEERRKFHLLEVVANRPAEVIERCQTGSIATQSQVYGRDQDKEKVIDSLVDQISDADDVSVYPIIGMGGLGKTTLAQLVYNDERVKRHFDLRIWVCVSGEFDVRRLVKTIIESASGNACPCLDLDPLQRQLQEILSGKRYLIVLDHVWNGDQDKWDRLKFVLACGSKGSSIIVTTRMEKVASVMGTLPAHNLSGLSEADCWLLFKERAFECRREEHPSIICIGHEIVKKCGGVPLAAKALGSLMRYKNGENEWLSVKESEIWDLPQDECSIMPALRLSYSNLPLKLRKCFVYCAIFPKDCVIHKEDIILLWMANGFISSTRREEPEDVGNEICSELCWRSLFQDVEKDKLGSIKRFKMHDLIHDLAHSVMEDEFAIAEAESLIVNSRQIHHVTLLTEPRQSFTIPEALYNVESLRTLLLQPILLTAGKPKVEFSCDLSRLTTLRVFGIRRTNLMMLSSSIRHLKHLRYLDLSSTLIWRLPESVSSLLNLQTLKLVNCVALQRLPKHIWKLKNLRHLYLNGCFSLTYMPPKIGQITCLKTLNLFIVRKGSGCHISELEALDLGGKLHIRHLERVGTPFEAKAANLNRKHKLQDLRLSWEGETEFEQQDNVRNVLEALEPHSNLEYLEIEGYRGNYFPYWMRDQILQNVVSIVLKKCKKCLQLPPLQQLPSLKYLELHGMDHILYVDQNFYGDRTANVFPVLKSLIIADSPSLLRLSIQEENYMFPCLASLSISNCPKLSLPCLSSLECLKVRFCNENLLSSISNLQSINSLSIAANNDLICLPHGMLHNLSCLHYLDIERFTKLKGLPTDLANLSSLQSLFISDCYELESFPEQGLQGLCSLKHLQLRNCWKFSSLSEGLQHLTALEGLVLDGCPDLITFPEAIEHLNTLQYLTISGQPTGIDASVDPTSTQFRRLTVLPESYGEPINYVGCPKLEVLPETLQHVPALQSLTVSCYPNMVSFPDWLGDITSLQSLHVFSCTKLASSPSIIQRLTKLQNLDIQQCPALSKRCEKETGEDRCKIRHVSNVHIYPSAQN